MLDIIGEQLNRPLIEYFRSDFDINQSYEKNFSINDVRDWLRQEIKRLLNTRSNWNNEFNFYHELKESVLVYGMPDINNCNTLSRINKKELCLSLKEIISQQIKRLLRVEVIILNHNNNNPLLTVEIYCEVSHHSKKRIILFESIINPYKNRIILTKGRIV